MAPAALSQQKNATTTMKNAPAKADDDYLYDLDMDDPEWIDIVLARQDARNEIVDPVTGLTSTETSVAHLYLQTLDTLTAARKLKCTEATVKKLLNKSRVKHYIAKRTLESEDYSLAQNKEILGQLTDIALADIRTLVDGENRLLRIHELPARTARALKSVKVVTRAGPPDESGRPTIQHVHEYGFWDKLSALDKLAKHRGLLADGLSDQTSATDIERRRALRQELLGLLGDLAKPMEPGTTGAPLTITQDGSDA